MRRNLTTDQIQDVIRTLSGYLSTAKSSWDQAVGGKGSWTAFTRGHMVQGAMFLLGVTDQLIQLVEKIIPSGPDKKSAVLLAVANVFDYISATAFPIWLRPFLPLIKQVIISGVISNLIEFIVGKYRSGAWKMGDKNGQQEIVTGQKNQPTTLRS